MEKDYRDMDVRTLLKEVESLCGWEVSAKEKMAEALSSVKTTEELEALISMHIDNLKYLAYAHRNENNCCFWTAIEALEKTIVLYLFAGIQKDGDITSMAFYNLDEAKYEAEAWKKDNDGYVYIAVCATTENEVKERLKYLPEIFLGSHPELEDPRDEYALSLAIDPDMIVAAVYSEWDGVEMLNLI